MSGALLLPEIDPMNPSAVLLKDPVCGMPVTDKSEHRTEHDGRLYFFCSANCQGKFAADPQRYTAPAPALAVGALPTPVAAPLGTVYTCPMHPEVRQEHTGSCPKCGMTLEPELPTLVNDDNPELRDFSRRFWWPVLINCNSGSLSAQAGFAMRVAG
jgi:Cu+-exporting ATPase